LALLPTVALLAAPAGADTGSDQPNVSAPAAIVLEASGDGLPSDADIVLYGRNDEERRAIASTTKIMTALVAIEHARPGRVLRMQPYAPAPEETTAGLPAGERFTVRELLEAMLLPSGGDAAHALALDLAGSTARFVDWMNATARRLGMRHTHYATPVGLDTPGNYSSAGDLARLAVVVLRNPTLASVVNTPRAVLGDGQVMVNRNDLVGRYPWVVGVKTGHTANAGHCLVGAARHGDTVVISVVLGDPSEGARDADTLTLLHYGLGHLRRVEPRRRHQPSRPSPAGMIRS
jgi:D-alanyl-D-alanine carboxypeptidase (penicillin-binding protein 5/6)